MTNGLRKLIRTKLLTINGIEQVYYGQADKGAMYPHIVFYFDGINVLADDNNRRDYRLYVDVWDKSTSFTTASDIADSVVKLLNKVNDPQTDNLPTIYFETANNVIDEDKSIKHYQIRFTIQNYER